ncbi:hypothetical protein [Amycolatopsis sp. NPDC051371]|uniref:hypothetical protein n=1 Tax=Amycolatopsis sp. NPDC051371 TaxID=3155800 RepID=UPI0034234667
MTSHEPVPRHHRRRANSAARAAFDEARRAGLVQRHLTKLRYLAAPRPERQPHTDTTRPTTVAPAHTEPGSGTPLPVPKAQLPPPGTAPIPGDAGSPSSTSDAA